MPQARVRSVLSADWSGGEIGWVAHQRHFTPQPTVNLIRMRCERNCEAIIECFSLGSQGAILIPRNVVANAR